ncbi:MAG: hypothetical protein Q7K39_01780 [Candidatus Magasanikbacteria bacterium]|nr:hypothetical protein [Candidatus Magasanikbacteria bacterium]
MPPVVTLTILTNNFEEFKKQAEIAQNFLPYIQIDVMDGQFVPGTSFAERIEINSLKLNLKYELHLMVAHPLAEMKTWAHVKNVFRVIFPIEAEDNPTDCVAFAKNQGWSVGIVINPETDLNKVKKYWSDIEVLLFMTVHPGAQGAPFVPAVLEKIKEFTKENGATRPLCAVDGGVNLETAPQLVAAGAEILNVGSFFTKAADMEAAYNELVKTLI